MSFINRVFVVVKIISLSFSNKISKLIFMITTNNILIVIVNQSKRELYSLLQQIKIQTSSCNLALLSHKLFKVKVPQQSIDKDLELGPQN